ncbi:SH3 domain-containing protein [Aestuariispira insulae]|uniref:SH3 domain-containing protein n=1 Tax=Aestuariispira insulae TaxID=1461337 RepID=A0A3D9H3Y6_9PROT|nr:SH3 domain-containing protein [Aestuariispira insulae]RED44214.1 SH3 domain-containing protein [Aestuariispira insulae]
MFSKKQMTARPVLRSTCTLRAMLAAVSAGFLLSACGTPSYVNENRSRAEMGNDTPSVETVSYKIHNAFREQPPLCVAVLPLDDNGKLEPSQREGVRRIFYAQLAPQKKRDVELQDVDNALLALPEEFRDDPVALGYALECDTMLTGRITHYGSGFYGLYSNVSVGADVKLIRTTDGAVLWEGRHVASSHGGSVPFTPVGLVSGMVRAANNVNGEQLDRVTNDLARRLVSTIPDNTEFLYARVPAIKLRTGPGSDYPVVDLYPAAGKLEYIGPSEDKDWVTVRDTAGQLAYVLAQDVTMDREAVPPLLPTPDMASCQDADFDPETDIALASGC